MNLISSELLISSNLNQNVVRELQGPQICKIHVNSQPAHHSVFGAGMELMLRARGPSGSSGLP